MRVVRTRSRRPEGGGSACIVCALLQRPTQGRAPVWWGEPGADPPFQKACAHADMRHRECWEPGVLWGSTGGNALREH